MKRITATMLCLGLLILSACLTVVTFAAGTPTITCTADRDYYYPGDTVTVTATVSDNPGIMTLIVTPTYSSELGAPSVANGSILPTPTTGKNYVWVADEDVTKDGTLVTMTFTIGEDVAPGDYNVGLIFRSAVNYDEQTVTFSSVDVTITVRARPVSVTGVALDKETASIGTGDGTLTLTPIFTPGTATNKNVTWLSSEPSVATVEGGVVTPLKKGTTTITVTTEDGNFSASCVVTVTCSHLHTTEHPEEASSCIRHGHDAYKTCDDCGEITEGSDAELPLSGHAYTETVQAKFLKTAATCRSKAVYYKSCSVCGEAGTETFEAGEPDYTNHVGETYLKDKKAPTCYAEGYTGDTYCSACNHEISKGTTIGKTAHDPADEWTTDGEFHWKKCRNTGCTEQIDKAAHSGGEATCKDKAVCEICGTAYGELNANNHKNTEIRDAVEPTCSKAGYTGDTWCKDCETKIADGEEIAATGNHVDADGKWESDGENHWHTCTCGAEFDKVAHSGGEATCKDKAVCEICGASYGELNANNHKHTEIRDTVEPTCSKAGYTGDTWCKDCEIKIKDGAEIAATGKHVDADGKWESDGENHWHTCTCGAEFDKVAHSGGEATCVSPAPCAACKTTYGETNPNRHKHTVVRNASTPTCVEGGYSGDTWCTDCNKQISTGSYRPATGNHVDADGKWESDGENHWHTCGCGAEFDKVAHSGGEATCKDKAVCEICGTAYGELAAHTYESAWSSDANGHWHACSVCGVKSDEAAHTPGAAATETTPQTCTVCNYVIKAALGHTHKFTEKNTDAKYLKSSATCTARAVYYYSCACGERGTETFEFGEALAHTWKTEWSSDADKHWHVCSVCGAKADEAVHNFAWKTDKEAGVTEAGKKHEECTVCGYKKAPVAIDKLAPSIVDGKGATWNPDSKAGLIFRSDAAIADFIEVLLDGEVVAPEHYDVREGSIIVELKADFLATLTEGEHTLTIRSASGDATTPFTAEAGTQNSTTVILIVVAAVLVLAIVAVAIVLTRKKKVK